VILLGFAGIGFPHRNEPYRCPTPGVGHDVDSPLNTPNGDAALLTIVTAPIDAILAPLVQEHARHIFKWDAMLLEVTGSLRGIPLELEHGIASV
jgi:hypothetical protein